VQRTAEFHHQITEALLAQADAVFHDATALDTAVDVLDPSSAMVQSLVCQLLLQGELLAIGFLRWHQDLHVGERKREEAQILPQPTPDGQWRGRRVGDPLIMDAASPGVTEKEDGEQGMHEQDIFDGVVLFLTALTCRLCRRV
jgi:hypothetical protein